MKTVIIIPARYASSRYPGKPLVDLTLPDGSCKSLIRMSWEAACQVSGVDAIFVATDDERIRAAAEGFGADVIMTSKSCENGTERCADAMQRAGIKADLVVNFQGDAPLTPNWFVEELIGAMLDDPQAQVATPVLRCDLVTYGHLIEDRRAGRVGGTTAIFDDRQHALYFSKEVIPFIDATKVPQESIPVFHHVGVYAYRPEVLAAYRNWPAGILETCEGLEQLRFLHHGIAVRCVLVEGRNRVFWELNNPSDVSCIENALKEVRDSE